MAMKKVGAPAPKPAAKAAKKPADTTPIKTGKPSGDKVQASEKSAPKAPVKGDKDVSAQAKACIDAMLKNAGAPPELATEPTEHIRKDGSVFERRPLLKACEEFILAEGCEPGSLAHLEAWEDTPFTASGKKNRSCTTPLGRFIAKCKKEEVTLPGQDAAPAAKGRVKEAGRITSPGPRPTPDIAKKLRGPKDGEVTAPDRVDEDGCRMATKANGKPRGGKHGLTITAAQALLKTAENTPARGYSKAVTALCKNNFAGKTVSALQAKEINLLVEECRAQGLIA